MTMGTDKSSRNQELKKMAFSEYAFYLSSLSDDQTQATSLSKV